MNEEDVLLWVARDLDGKLFLYSKKPYKGFYSFVPKEGDPLVTQLNSKLLSEITWEDSPVKVQLTPIIESV